jgi:hypothetical protein
MTLSFFVGRYTVKPSVIQGVPDTIIVKDTVRNEFVQKAVSDRGKRKAQVQDSLITINVEYDSETDKFNIDYVAKLTTTIIKQVDTIFVKTIFPMDTVEVPEKPFWDFEKGFYTGMIAAVGAIASIGYAVYKLITAGKQ